MDKIAATTGVGRVMLDIRRAKLSVGGRPVKLRPQSLEVLRILIQNAGQLVSRQGLLDQVWGDTVVTDDSLIQCLRDIRRALNDTDKTIVRTVPKRGYVFDGDPVPPGPELPRTGKLWLAGAVMVLATASIWLFAGSPADRGTRKTPPSIAVLPFVDLTAEQDKRHLGEGLSEEILLLLSQSPELRVIARTSSFATVESRANVEAIGAQLDVTHVLEGSIREGDDRLRITAQLIDARDSALVWSTSVDQPLGDILQVQSDIANRVADALQVALQVDHPASAVDPYAHALVIQARSMLHLLDRPGNQRARLLLQQALRIEPNNVRAHIELARAYFQQRGPRGTDRYLAAWAKTNELTDRAYELDSDSPWTNAWKGWQALHYYQDFEAAARYYERANELDPNNADICRLLINALVILGDADDAMKLGKDLVARDPLCIPCYNYLGLAAYAAGDPTTGADTSRRILQFNPDHHGAWLNLSSAYLQADDPRAALDTLEHYPDREDSSYLMISAIANFRLGRIAEYKNARARLVELHEDSNPTVVARVDAVAGDIDSAFRYLEKNMKLPAWQRSLAYLGPNFANLRSDPRWKAYLERLGLAPAQLEAIKFSVTMPIG